MSYTKLTDFAAKDALLSGNPSKLLRGTEIGAEFDAIESAMAAAEAVMAAAEAVNITAPIIAASTSKTTPVDADVLPILDSAAANILKKVTWTNIKATLKTYFDTLYAAVGSFAASGDNNDITALSALVGAGLVPVGGIVEFAASSVPAGYLVLPVAATNISRATYARLFSVIGTTWGAGDGSTTFGMPWIPEDYSTVQANGNVGTTTTGSVIAHDHSINPVSIQSGGRVGGDNHLVQSGAGLWATGSTGGSANMPAGVRMVKCIKY